jgi:DNA repair protein RecO (recombination protein O)|tara:strand:- start:97 stop:771 length:675 start_codon:yes stop_codon:yes gene_type:complete
MKFEDKGFLISKNKYNENSAIVEFYTINNGKVSGLIFGATSTKLKNFLFLGNLFNVQFNSKNQNKTGYFKVEIEKVFTPHFLDDKIKLNCILYSLNLIKILTVENQSNQKIYLQIVKLYELLSKNDWIKNFIFWELEIIKLVGYDINFNDYVDKSKIKNNQSHVPLIDGSKEIPYFLLNDKQHTINNDDLKDGLKIVGDFLNKSVLIPNNINYPILRNEFIKLI